MDEAEDGARPLLRAIARGAGGRCPRCGRGPLFGRFLKVAPACEACGLALSGHRADDLPPYVVIFLVGHVVGALVLETELRLDDVPLWASMTGWTALAAALAFLLIQPVKGGVVGLQYALGMHGFSGAGPDDVPAERSGQRGTRS